MATRTFEKNGFTYTVKRVVDPHADVSYLEQDYSDCPSEEAEKYKAQDAERLEDYNEGRWEVLVIVVEIRKNTKTNWANGGFVVGRASLGGIESDSDESFFKEEEEGLIEEAEEEVKRLKEALQC